MTIHARMKQDKHMQGGLRAEYKSLRREELDGNSLTCPEYSLYVMLMWYMIYFKTSAHIS
jgi:hypothetical protein